MAEHYHPKSKGTWGREPYKTDAELNAICTEFFNQMKVPKEWQFKGYDRCFDEGIKTELHPTGTITSIGARFLDTRTKGIDLKQYRVAFLTFSCRAGILEKTFIDYGKPAYNCVVSNLTVEKLNEYIKENYW